jgi:ribonuclease PH
LDGTIAEHALSETVGAVSVGIVGGVAMLDLPYEEDVRADTDMNVVMTGSGRFVEVQGTAEHEPFDRSELDALLDLAAIGIGRIHYAQRELLATPPAPR